MLHTVVERGGEALTGTTLLLAIGLFVLLLFLHYLFGAEHPVRCVCYSGGLGLVSLLLTHVVGVLAGFSLPVSLLSLLVSAAAGPAGVTALLICNTWIV